MFTEQERRIYGPYQDGRGNQVFADPEAVYRHLMAETAGELNAITSQYNESELGMAIVAERLASAAIVAFDLKPFDKATGQGTLQDDALNLVGNFLDWRDQKKTPPAASPTFAPSMGQDGSHAGNRPPSVTRRTTLSG